uniref:Protein FAR1-RELATED SEQUENCE n=1 Tax=Aegilops tauschii subsp. strangulata TaxID=200361 RepID=A0A453I3L3_AEGTS
MHPQAQSPRRISSALAISATATTGCISELPISFVEKFSSRDKLQQIVTAASTVKDVEHASAVIHNSSVDHRCAYASSHGVAHLTCPATSVENTSAAEYEPNFSMMDGASATKSGKSLQTQMNEREFTTPRKKESIPLFCSSFTPSCDEKFTGVNHHLQSVFFGAAFLCNEQTESYVWLFETFLTAMGGVAPRLIITDEAVSMKNAIETVFPTTVHRLCMWHIMEKLPEKIGPIIREESEFWDKMNSCVWGSETPAEFESQWNSVITEYGLEENEWLVKRFSIRESWIPAYFMDIPLAGILRTTSRSESANSFFNRFIHRKLALVEFWLRFDMALECQREEELIADNSSIHTTPQLLTPWEMEKQGRDVFTYEVFEKFQKEIVAARDHCCIQGIAQDGTLKIVTLRGRSHRIREVQSDTKTMIAHCSCKLFETIGIPCRHIMQVLRAENQNELPSYYIMKRWKKRCKRENVYDEHGNLIEEKATDSLNEATRKKISVVRNKLEDLIQKAKHSDEGMDFLTSSVLNIEAPLDEMVPTSGVKHTRQDENEAFIGCNIPTEIDIHPPTDVRTVGRCKRIKRGKEISEEEQKKKKKEAKVKVARLCKTTNSFS